MTCSPGVILPRTRVDSPGVWSRFARELRISLFLLEISENHKNQVKFKIFSDRWMDGWLSCNKARCQTNPVDQCVKQSSGLVDESRWWLKSDDSSIDPWIDPSTSTKCRESDYSMLRKLTNWNIGHNLYQANRLSVWAKRLQIPGESTLGPGEMTPGKHDIGQNDCKSVQHIVQHDMSRTAWVSWIGGCKFNTNDTGFAPWRVRPHRVRPQYKTSISSSPPPLSSSPPTFRVRPQLLCSTKNTRYGLC